MNFVIRSLLNFKNIKIKRSLSSLSQLERSFMYVPGDKHKMIEKMISYPLSQAPDIIVLDCEDGVSYDNKNLARENILKSVSSGSLRKCTHSTICIRANGVTTPLLIVDDIKLICESLIASNYHYPQMVNLPKVENFTDVLWLDEKIKSNLDTTKLARPIQLSIMVESCSTVVKLNKLLKNFSKKQLSCFELANIVFGSDDYCGTLGVPRSRSNDEVLYARQHVANVAAAFKVPAIDMVDIDLIDMEYFERNCKFGASIGFSGKQVIHPKQLEIVHAAFSPTPAKSDWAVELLKEYEKKKEKEGAFVFKNQMIDMPTILQAQAIVRRCDLIRQRAQ